MTDLFCGKIPRHLDFTTKFSHPCRGTNTTVCDACREKDDLEFEANIIPGLACTDRSVAVELARANRSAQNENHDPIILRLPPEVACKIFEFCETDPNGADIYDNRLELLCVCQGWRRLVLATPQLWARIEIPLSSDSPLQPQASEEWLKRAGNLPLNILVYDHIRLRVCPPPREPQPSRYSNAKTLIDLVNSVTHRWEYLILYGITHDYVPMFRGNDKGSPMLRDLVVMPFGPEVYEGLKYFSLKEKPKPYNIALSKVPINSIEISWTQLKFAVLQSVFNAGLIFDRAPNIEHCVIPLAAPRCPELDGPDTLLREFSDRVVLPHLRHLQLAVCDELWRLKNLLQRLKLPALEVLGIIDYGYHCYSIEHLPLSEISSFLVNSSCNLKGFRLDRCQFSAYDLINFLASKQMQSLESLELRFDGWFDHWEETPLLTGELFKKLAGMSVDAHSKNSSPFLPSLRSLIFGPGRAYDQLGGCTDRKFPWDCLLRMLAPSESDLNGQSRRPLTDVKLLFTCLKDQSLNNVISMDEATIRSLAGLERQAGLNFEIVEAESARDELGAVAERDLLEECKRAIGIL